MLLSKELYSHCSGPPMQLYLMGPGSGWIRICCRSLMTTCSKYILADAVILAMPCIIRMYSISWNALIMDLPLSSAAQRTERLLQRQRIIMKLSLCLIDVLNHIHNTTTGQYERIFSLRATDLLTYSKALH